MPSQRKEKEQANSLGIHSKLWYAWKKCFYLFVVLKNRYGVK